VFIGDTSNVEAVSSILAEGSINFFFGFLSNILYVLFNSFPLRFIFFYIILNSSRGLFIQGSIVPYVMIKERRFLL
jgi:hypothetical protein